MSYENYYPGEGNPPITYGENPYAPPPDYPYDPASDYAKGYYPTEQNNRPNIPNNPNPYESNLFTGNDPFHHKKQHDPLGSILARENFSVDSRKENFHLFVLLILLVLFGLFVYHAKK